MKRFYVSPWFWLAIAALFTALAGALNEAALLIFSLFALALLGRSASPRANRQRRRKIRRLAGKCLPSAL